MNLPTESRIVIVGGGIVGCSIAYHLARLGCREVVLLEQNTLAGGTTWHAAGLVGRLRTSTSLTAINKYSAELYAGLEKETGHSIGWKQVGSLIVGRSKDRMIQLHRTAAMAECFGVETHILDPEGVRQRWPLLRIDDIQGGAWLPHDGKVIPKEVAYALALGAKNRGVTIVEHARVSEILTRNGRACGARYTVRNPDGSGTSEPREIAADLVVLSGGMWARELGLRIGVSLPLYPVEHHYVVTHPIPGAFDELPVGRDPDLCLYFRGEGNAVMLGAFQAESKPWMVDRVPQDFSFQLLEPDWEKFSDPLKNGKHRIPALETSGFEKFVNGPESFTPDNQFLMGETPEIQRLFVACGFNSVGIASAGGAGKYLAEWILEGQPSIDLWSVDVRRFGPWANNRAYLRSRVVEVLGLHYQMAWPNREFETARGVRRSPLHNALATAGASFGAKGGWERPNWFARPDLAAQGAAPTPSVEYAWGRQNWFHNHALEHRAARESVALFDQSSFAKLTLEGPSAASLLQRLCANNIDVPNGRIVYTAMLNGRGGFESDLTVVRLAQDKFLLITGTTQGIRDADWIRRHVQADEVVFLQDVTAANGVLGVMGPRSRELLSRVTDADLSHNAWPFATARTLAIGHATARALRITYVGELGWELHLPADQMLTAYETLMEAGRDLGVTNAGHYAINSLRLEKGYRAFGSELSPDETPLEAGLGFALDWRKPFLGRDALLKQKENGLRKRLGILVLENPEPVLWGSEPVFRDGTRVGYTTSGSYAHSLGAGIGMAYVRHTETITDAWLSSGRYEILVNGVRQPARIHLRAPYDPDRRRILG